MDRPSRRLPSGGTNPPARPSSSIRPRGAPGSAGAERPKPASGTLRAKEDSNVRRKPGSAVRRPEPKEEPQEEVQAPPPVPGKPPQYDYEFKEDPPAEPDTRKKTGMGAPRGPRSKSSRFPNPVDIAANADPLAPSKQRSRSKRGSEQGNPNMMYAMIGGAVLLIAIVAFAMSGGEKKPVAKKSEGNKRAPGVSLVVEDVNWATVTEGVWNVSGTITNKGDTLAEKVCVVFFPCGDYARVNDKSGKSQLVATIVRFSGVGVGESTHFTTNPNIPAIKSDGMSVLPESHSGPFITWKGCPAPPEAVAEAIFDPLDGEWGGAETEMQKKRAEGFKKGDGS